MSDRRINEVACQSAGIKAKIPKLDDPSGIPIPRPFPTRRSIVLNRPCSHRPAMCSYRSWLPRLPSFFARENFYPKFALFLVALQLLNALSNSQLVVPSLQGSPAQSSPSNESSSSNALKEYVIYSVVDGPSPDDDNEKVRLHLAMLLAPADVQEYGGGYTGVDFWHVKMSDMQRTAFASANPKVCPISLCGLRLLTNGQPQIHENRQFLYHEDLIRWGQNLDQNVSHPEMSLYATRSEVSIDSDSSTARTVYQSDAPPDLKVVSWAPNVPFSKSKSYAYDPAGGGESSVYVIENGIVGFNRVNKIVKWHAGAPC